MIVAAILVISLGAVYVGKNLYKKTNKPNQNETIKKVEDSEIADDGNQAEVNSEFEDKKSSTKPTETSQNVSPPVIVSKAPKKDEIPQTIPKTLPSSPSVPPSIPTAPAPVVNSLFTTESAQSFIEDEVLKLVNAERANKQVGSLAFEARLRQAADIRVSEEAITSFVGIDHNRPDGRNFGTVLSEVGYSGATMWGENLVWGYQSQVSFTESQLKEIANKMFINWKNSPGHYANMIKGDYNQTGIGVVLKNQNGRTYWFGAQIFARR